MKMICPKGKSGDAPEGYEVAPDGHVAREGVDVIKWTSEVTPEKNLNNHDEPPPDGYEWVLGLASRTALDLRENESAILYRPIPPTTLTTPLQLDIGERLQSAIHDAVKDAKGRGKSPWDVLETCVKAIRMEGV
jgi:hypothetical protein